MGKYAAVYNETAFSGIGILDIGIDGDCDQYIKYQRFVGDKVGRTYKTKVHYDGKGHPYIISARNRYYMSEFIKIA